MGCAILFCLFPLGACCASLDSAIARAMQGRPGTALVADAGTGRLLASYRLDLARTLVSSPGSTLKPFTLAAWIEAHAGAAPGAWPCPRQLRIGGRRFDCTHPVPAAAFDPASALAYSCNCYFAHLAQSLEPREFAQALRSVASAVHIATTAEELQMQAIGEWGIQVTPLEMLAAWRRLANQRAQPALEPIFAGLAGAVTYGSAQLAGVTGLAVAGKTGTGPHHAWFAGFAPAAAPELVVVVFLERGRGGSDAAPVAGEIFQAYARGRQ